MKGSREVREGMVLTLSCRRRVSTTCWCLKALWSYSPDCWGNIQPEIETIFFVWLKYGNNFVSLLDVDFAGRNQKMFLLDSVRSNAVKRLRIPSPWTVLRSGISRKYSELRLQKTQSSQQTLKQSARTRSSKPLRITNQPRNTVTIHLRR